MTVGTELLVLKKLGFLLALVMIMVAVYIIVDATTIHNP